MATATSRAALLHHAHIKTGGYYMKVAPVLCLLRCMHLEKQHQRHTCNLSIEDKIRLPICSTPEALKVTVACVASWCFSLISPQ